MKLKKILSVLSFLTLGVSMPAFAEEEQGDQVKQEVEIVLEENDVKAEEAKLEAGEQLPLEEKATEEKCVPCEEQSSE